MTIDLACQSIFSTNHLESCLVDRSFDQGVIQTRNLIAYSTRVVSVNIHTITACAISTIIDGAADSFPARLLLLKINN